MQTNKPLSYTIHQMEGDEEEAEPLMSKRTYSNTLPATEPAKFCGLPVSLLIVSWCLGMAQFGDALLYAVLPVIHDEAGKVDVRREKWCWRADAELMPHHSPFPDSLHDRYTCAFSGPHTQYELDR